jgi:RNA polymerase sigma-70 factor (ECF subfamily)
MTTADVSEQAARVWPGESVDANQDFDRLFREHYRLVYDTAYGVLGNTYDAEDVAQTVFLRLSDGRSLQRLQPHPERYLYRAAVNQSLNVIRGRIRHRDTASAAHYASAHLERPTTESPEDVHKRLYQAVAELSSRAAAILILKYVHNCTHAEIARRLGTSQAAVGVSVFRSRTKLQRLLRDKSSRGKS